jgi:Lon protease-like protein
MTEPQEISLPSDAPVMALPNAMIFPDTLLPLHIFEPRYRAMLAYALERHRMFCVGHIRPGITEANGLRDLFPVSGIGLIRASVGSEDGTSNLVLQGLARVRLLELAQEKPFLIARVSELRPDAANPIEAEALGTKVIELTNQLKVMGVEIPAALRQEIAHVASPGIVCDKVANALVNDPLMRQAILEEAGVSARLRLLISVLRQKLLGQ